MKNLILYEIGDKVSLTPAYVAMRAIEESEEDVERHILEAKDAIGVVVDITFNGDNFHYSIKWIQGHYHPSVCAWFYDFEVCSPEAKFDWTQIPFDEYRSNPYSTNHISHKQFRKQVTEEIKISIQQKLLQL